MGYLHIIINLKGRFYIDNLPEYDILFYKRSWFE